ncbi:MAG: mechanosensitive ion channel family protein [Treponema sp.]|nr:mechanosensitive ion channel family protein [Treponema sp.]
MDESIGGGAKAAGESFLEQTSSFLNWLKSFLTWENLFKFVGALIILTLLWVVYKLILKGLKKIPAEKTTPQRTMIVNRFVKYIYYVIVIIYILSLFGVKLSAIWGAAGIAGIAIGFAAQTSVSNLISGLFILTEGSIHAGDLIIVNDITGVVDSVNLLSIEVHTLDNQMVRIPNSTIINSSITNNSYHTDRRIQIALSINYDADMTKALEALKKVPELCPTVLSYPETSVWYEGFGESGINIILAAWYKNNTPTAFIDTKNALYIAIKKVLDEAGIEIPYNQLDVKIKGDV